MLRTSNKVVSLAVVAWLGIGSVVAAGVGFVAYGVFLYFGTGWLAFFLSAAGTPNDTRDKIVAAIMTPEAWLYYAPAGSVLLYFAGVTLSCCCSRSLLLRLRDRTQLR
jgi:hypothetical protein